jgi:hypothetical protein
MPWADTITAGFIEDDHTKPIAPKFFFTHEQQGRQIFVQWISSSQISANLLTKSLPPNTHKDLTKSIGMRNLAMLLQASEHQVNTTSSGGAYKLAMCYNIQLLEQFATAAELTPPFDQQIVPIQQELMDSSLRNARSSLYLIWEGITLPLWNIGVRMLQL